MLSPELLKGPARICICAWRSRDIEVGESHDKHYLTRSLGRAVRRLTGMGTHKGADVRRVDKAATSGLGPTQRSRARAGRVGERGVH